MAFRIGDFTTNINKFGETARADKFDCIIGLPATMAGSTAYGPRELALQCEASELPGVDIIPIEYRHHAFIKRMPHHVQFSPITLTFYCTGGMLEKQLFDAWTNLCVNRTTGLVNYRDDDSGNKNWEGTVYINQYDMVGNWTYFAAAQEAFPISVQPLGLNWGDDSIHRLAVTFGFTKWLVAADGAQGASTGVQQSASSIVSNYTNLIPTLFTAANFLGLKNVGVAGQILNRAQIALKNPLGGIKSQLGITSGPLGSLTTTASGLFGI